MHDQNYSYYKLLRVTTTQLLTTDRLSHTIMKTYMQLISSRIRVFQQGLSVILLIGLVVPIALGSFAETTIAQSKVKLARKSVRFRLPPIPKGDPPGGTGSGGAGRDNCPQVNVPLTVLMPTSLRTAQTGRQVKDVWGLTTTESSPLWFYSPYSEGDRYPVELIIRQDHRNGKILARRSVLMPKNPGVFTVLMPESLMGMKVNDRHYWQLNLNCNPKRMGVPIRLEGMVQRVEVSPSDLKALETAETPHDRAAQYADRGIWLDALNLLGNARTAEPENLEIKEDWRSLLDSAGLSTVLTD